MGWFEDVLVFHRKFGMVVQEKPSWPDEAIVRLRTTLISDELKELSEALTEKDLPETADALADLIYVLIGTAVSFGIDLRPVWDEVQRTNLAKEGGATRADGKVLKPAGWIPPDIAGALERGKVTAPYSRDEASNGLQERHQAAER